VPVPSTDGWPAARWSRRARVGDGGIECAEKWSGDKNVVETGKKTSSAREEVGEVARGIGQ
jgi:hypothetical protein